MCIRDRQRLEQSFLTPLRHPELREQYGAEMRGGLLIWGPPGCGKTFLARAVAGELGAQFMSVGLHHVLDEGYGNSEKQLHAIFESARHHQPCVLFFDELDALGQSRSKQRNSPGRNLVAQLLVELDGVEFSNNGIYVIGATNQPWDVDPALRRPGRFDRTLLLLLPDLEARRVIFTYQLRDRRLENVDFDELARLSDGLSGADIRLVCTEASERALHEAITTSTSQPVTAAFLRDAISSVRPSTVAWFESARNYVRYANDSGEYDELATYLKSRKKK